MFRYHRELPESVYYDKRLEPIDEKICALLKERRSICGGNPGRPGEALLENWSRKYGIYENLLSALFSELRNEEEFKPRVEPKGFRKFLPVMQGVKKEDRFFYVTYIRQYDNASVLTLNRRQLVKEWAPFKPGMEDPGFLELDLGIQGYDCRSDAGSGSDGEFNMDFIISPALPDDYKELDLTFTEYERLPEKKATGNVVLIHLKNRE
ncbi:hypothetical protein E4665_03420 [Sporolactobacillus shoreae]|uniref:Uncharacterized protein n=1 Tax=Sporolactobacillus shoreae TaxID=1465501 RepID=A0A4Z0GQ85_9BACL|nr:hypothetical protein [Sporolactobacillus shoreae]TGA99393.1 hypothetical protein E4665_03420 [Sporolactobacillus shoreae]